MIILFRLTPASLSLIIIQNHRSSCRCCLGNIVLIFSLVIQCGRILVETSNKAVYIADTLGARVIIRGDRCERELHDVCRGGVCPGHDMLLLPPKHHGSWVKDRWHVVLSRRCPSLFHLSVASSCLSHRLCVVNLQRYWEVFTAPLFACAAQEWHRSLDWARQIRLGCNLVPRCLNCLGHPILLLLLVFHVLHSLWHLVHGSSKLRPFCIVAIPIIPSFDTLGWCVSQIDPLSGKFLLRIKLKLSRGQVLSLDFLLYHTIIDDRVLGQFLTSSLGFIDFFATFVLLWIWLMLLLGDAWVVFLMHALPQVQVVRRTQLSKLFHFHIQFWWFIQRVHHILSRRHETIENLYIVFCRQPFCLLGQFKHFVSLPLSLIIVCLAFETLGKEITRRVWNSDLPRALPVVGIAAHCNLF